ncbi:hypothetical protein ACFIQG_20550 [Comamonas odontotermitis]|uniref:hypothetical protein n=1 Tax=Comamonas odontotermitis TaxID=379895 RepID=UPI00366EBD1D
MSKIIPIAILFIALFWILFDEYDQKSKMTTLVLNDNTMIIKEYISKNGKSPSDLNSLKDLGINKFDAWGKEFIYKKCGNLGYSIYSAGRNKIAGDSDDIKNNDHADCK